MIYAQPIGLLQLLQIHIYHIYLHLQETKVN